MLGDPPGAGRRARLLVRSAREQDIPPEAGDRIARGVPAGGAGSVREESDHAELHGDHALHVDGTTPVHVPVGEVRGERIVAPTVRRRRNDIEV